MMTFFKQTIRLSGWFFFLVCTSGYEVNAQDVKQSILLGTTIDVFSDYYDAMYLNTVGYSVTTTKGAGVIKLNQAHRFNQVGYQVDAELYPKLGTFGYGYLAYATSSAAFFPEHRIGAELFMPFLKKWEASAGIRYLSFQSGMETWVYTASLSHYVGSWLFSVRPFIIPTEEQLGGSLLVNARKFINDTDSFGFRLGVGASPDERLIQLDTGFSERSILLLVSQQLAVYANKTISKNWDLRASLGLNRDELAFLPNTFVWHGIIDFGIAYTF
jgi:YaiO family outer membrane protein